MKVGLKQNIKKFKIKDVLMARKTCKIKNDQLIEVFVEFEFNNKEQPFHFKVYGSTKNFNENLIEEVKNIFKSENVRENSAIDDFITYYTKQINFKKSLSLCEIEFYTSLLKEIKKPYR